MTNDTLFFAAPNKAQTELYRVEEAKTLIQRYGDVALIDPPDITPLVQRLTKHGPLHSLSELADLATALRTLRKLYRWVHHHGADAEAPLLWEKFPVEDIPQAVCEQLEALVTEAGQLIPGVCPKYDRILQAITKQQQDVQAHLTRMIHSPQVAPYLQDTVLTQRDGQWVLAIKATHKSAIAGEVLAASASGETVYITPQRIVEATRHLRSLQTELETILQAFLKTVSEPWFEEAPHMLAFLEQAGQLDLTLAKARQSLAWNSNPVTILEEPGVIQLIQARHPLLLQQREPVVANDIRLEPPQRVMVLSGPNTGGKTVLLKLVGLFALMSRAGLHIPAKADSAMAWFDPVLVDLGDPQSIAHQLSTFSGHLLRLKTFLETPDLTHTLILVDELCAGTDPGEGAALAQAFLETFYRQGATVLVTTHMQALTLTAHTHPGYVNASVAFDPEALKPTYRLLHGVPGTSHALRIATLLGLPNTLITDAETHLAADQQTTRSLLEDLARQNHQLNESLAEAERLRQELAWEEGQLRTQLNQITGEKKKNVQQYHENLRDRLRSVELELDTLKAALKQKKSPSPSRVNDFKRRLKQANEKTYAVIHEALDQLAPTTSLAWEQVHPGDRVFSRSLDMVAVVVEKHAARHTITLQAGALKTTVPLSDLAPAEQSKTKPAEVASTSTAPRPTRWRMECDVRGMTAEDAVGFVDKFLDDALVSGAHEIAIIHGLGTGALKNAVRTHLKTLPYVKSFVPASATQGGDGKTIVTV